MNETAYTSNNTKTDESVLQKNWPEFFCLFVCCCCCCYYRGEQFLKIFLFGSYFFWEGGRERERERERGEGETDRQTDRQTDGQPDNQPDRQTKNSVQF